MILQLIRFAIVGVIASIVDVGVLVTLKEVLQVDVLLSSAVSFCVSVIVNYLLSMAFVFKVDGTSMYPQYIQKIKYDDEEERKYKKSLEKGAI